MMISKYWILAALALSVNIGCSRNCSELPQTFENYEEAIQQIEAASFKIDETIRTPESTWISSATFSSCDGSRGYFLLRVKNKKYLYYHVPIEIWEAFKMADSKGGYYNEFIKGRYRQRR
jgi:hypothetical protein